MIRVTYSKSKYLPLVKVIYGIIPCLKESFSLPENITILIEGNERVDGEDGLVVLGSASALRHGEYICRINGDYHSPYSTRILETLGHEFTHIEQMHQSRLRATTRNFLWIDPTKELKVFPIHGFSHQEYLDFPWEIEARQRGSEFSTKYATLISNSPTSTVMKMTNWLLVGINSLLVAYYIYNFFG